MRTEIFLVSFYVFGCMNKRTLPEHKELSINLVCPFACPTPATFSDLEIEKWTNKCFLLRNILRFKNVYDSVQ